MSHSSTLPINTDHASPIITELIYRLKIRDVMTSEVFTTTPDSTMRHAQQAMKANGISGMPVVEDERLVGIVSMDDVIQALVEGRTDSPIRDYMSRNVIVLEDDMPVSFGISYLDKYRFGRFPILNAGRQLVGIVTSRDIINALLLEIHREVERFEATYSQPQLDGPGFTLEYTTRGFDFETAGRLSTETKRQLKMRNLPPKLIRRVAVACYELEMNQVVHSHGGTVRVEYDPRNGTIKIVAADRGPGIVDLEEALTEGFSTATEWVRSLGFGAGMGLSNTRRVTDKFDIQSTPAGTVVRVTINTPEVSNEPA
jgi:CBS domain-containing protein